MAVILYRKGNTHTVDGVQCEQGRFKVKQMPALLASGWTGNINDLRGSSEGLAEEVTEEVSEEVPTKEEADTNNSGKLSPQEIREAAKEAGIEGWEKKRIATLEAELWPEQK